MRGTDHAKAMGVVIEEVNIKEGVQYTDKDLEAHKLSKYTSPLSNCLNKTFHFLIDLLKQVKTKQAEAPKEEVKVE